MLIFFSLKTRGENDVVIGPLHDPVTWLKLNILVGKLHIGTSKTINLPLFWKSHCATCSPVYVIWYHVTGSCKGPIKCPFKNVIFLVSRKELYTLELQFRY